MCRYAQTCVRSRALNSAAVMQYQTKRLALRAAEVAGNRLKISTMKVDVSSQEQVNDWHDMVMREHDGRVDYLINNAGYT